jgi:hypothetical protein
MNYWEYKNEYNSEETGYRSEGITELRTIDIRKNPDFSTNIDLHFLYYPEDQEPVLEEKRNIFVQYPEQSGSFFIDYQHVFLASFGEVVLDRTPIEGEPGGQSWGGYGGLSIRFNQDFTSPVFLPSVEPPFYPKSNWFYMGFSSLTGDKAGVSMFQHPDFTTPFTRWYYLSDPVIPFYFFSPAAIYDKNITIQKGDSLTLKYRVWISDESSEAMLESKYQQYIGN